MILQLFCLKMLATTIQHSNTTPHHQDGATTTHHHSRRHHHTPTQRQGRFWLTGLLPQDPTVCLADHHPPPPSRGQQIAGFVAFQTSCTQPETTTAHGFLTATPPQRECSRGAP